MTKELFIQRQRGGERALLVQVRIFQGDHHDDFGEALTEFRLLVLSAGVTILDCVTGKMNTPYPKYFIGAGKAEEITEIAKALQADVIIFNHALTPAQTRNLEQLCGVRVIDRSELILDIFAQRARTFEGKLQVELAQLQHLSSRLVRGWTHLERQKGGIGLRGPGETQLETDRRLVANRIKSIKKRLEKVETQRVQSRRARVRANLLVVAIVGYTNAGKSTLFNAMTESDVMVANQLFATLDPALRQIMLPTVGKIVFADTVGFIRQLPHEFIAAFKATLEETRQADLLLHVIDAHAENNAQWMETVNSVLQEIGAEAIPQLLVMNKIDLLSDFEPRIDYDDKKLPRRVWISAEKNWGFDLLRQAIVELLTKRIVQSRVTLRPHQGRLRAKLYELNVVKTEKLDAAGNWLLDLEIQQMDFERLFRG